jgi:hypothetical protein
MNMNHNVCDSTAFKSTAFKSTAFGSLLQPQPTDPEAITYLYAIWGENTPFALLARPPALFA